MGKRWIVFVLLLCLIGVGGCSEPRAAQPEPADTTAQTAAETTAESTTEEATEPIGFDLLQDERARQTVQKVSGLEVLSGTVIKMNRSSMQFTPASGDGTFAVNGKLTADSEIAFCINPAGILNYQLTVNVDTAREVKAEVRVFKGGKLLASHSQPGLLLEAGENEIDACVDTREGEMCFGAYVIRFYIDDCCVSETSEYL